MRASARAFLVIAALLPWAPPLAASGRTRACRSCEGTLVVVDHASGKTFLELAGRPKQELADGDEARVPIGSARVLVIHTHTALYTYAVTGEPVEAKEIASLKSFLAALGPYLTEVPAAESKRALETAARSALEEKLRKAQTIIDSLRALESRVLSELETISSADVGIDEDPWAGCADRPGDKLLREIEAKGIVIIKGKTSRAPGKDSCCDAPVRFRITYTDELLQALRDVADETAAVDAGGVAPVPAARVVAAARKMLAEIDGLTAFAYRVEDLFNLTVNDRTVWCSDEITISTSRGRKLTIRIEPRREPELARLARSAKVEETATLYPDWLVRPGIGLSLVYSPSSVYPDVGTEKSDSQFKVVAKGRQDFRFTYGLTLGMTWRGLDWRDGSGFALWLPELTVNPSSDVHALGVGLGFSWKIVKLGAGLLWTRHTVPDGSFGDLLADKEDLATRKAYGRRKAYMSLSIVGWPPFLPPGK